MDTCFRSRVTHDTDRLARTFARARVCLGALSANGQAAEMPDASIALDALKTLQVHTDFAAEVAFNDILAILDGMHDLGQLLFAQIFGANCRVNVGFGQNVFRITGADAVNVTQSNIDAFIRGNFYANDTSHIRTGLVDDKCFGATYCNQVQRISLAVVYAAHSSK